MIGLGDGRKIARGLDDKTFYDLETGKQAYHLGQKVWPTVIELGDGRKIARGMDDEETFYDIGTGKRVLEFEQEVWPELFDIGEDNMIVLGKDCRTAYCITPEQSVAKSSDCISID